MNKVNSMTGYILLDKAELDLDVFRLQFFDDWKIELEGEACESQFEFVLNEVRFVCTMVEEMLPDALMNASKNYSWQGAAEAISSHCAYVKLDLVECENDLQRHVLFTMVASSLMKQEQVIGMYQYPVTRKAADYIEEAERMQRDELPVLSWIYIGLYQDDQDLWNAYTYGLEEFGREEIEILHTEQGLIPMYKFLAELVGYLISYGDTLEAGQPVGTDDTHVYMVTRSEGSALDGDTLKIAF